MQHRSQAFAKQVLFVIVLVLTFSFALTSASGFQEEAEPTAPTFDGTRCVAVAGRILNEAGDPVADATLVSSLLDLQMRFHRGEVAQVDYSFGKLTGELEIKTDEYGKFRFPQELPIHQGHFLQIGHPDYCSSVVTDVSEEMNVMLAKGVQLSGRVTEENGDPLADVSVSISDDRMPGLPVPSNGMTRTGADGRFTLNHVDAGQMTRLKIQKNGYQESQLQFLPDSVEQPAEDSTPLTIKADYVRNNFVVKLPAEKLTGSVSIKAIDARTGEPAEISWVYGQRAGALSIDGPRVHAVPMRRGNYAEFTDLRPIPHRFWVKPNSSSELLGVHVDAIPKPGESIEKEARFSTGKIVRGRVVDEESGKPAPGVAVGYYPYNRTELESAQVMIPGFVRTDESGSFQMLVPFAPAELKIVGTSSGFVTLPPRHPTELPDTIKTRYIRKIDPTPDVAAPELEFKLPKSITFSGIVRYPDRKPAANIKFMYRRIPTDFICEMPKFGETDENGWFHIDSLFDDALVRYDEPTDQYLRALDKVHEFANRLPGARRANERKRLLEQLVAGISADQFMQTNRIIFWDENRGFAVIQEIKLADAENNPNGLNVILKPSASVVGRVIDGESGKGMGDVKIWMHSDRLFTTPEWKTTTDSRGRYQFTCVIPQIDFVMYTQLRDSISSSAKMRIVVAEGEEAIEVADIEVRGPVATRPIPDSPDVSKLPDRDALTALVAFVDEQMKDLPPAVETGWETRQKHLKNLADSIGDQAIRLAERDQDPAYQCEVYTSILNKLSDYGGNLDSSDLTSTARFVLTRNIDLEGVFEDYRMYSWSYLSDFYEFNIMDNSRKLEVRAWACQKLVSGPFNSQIIGNCRPARASTEQFEETLKKMEKIWIAAAGELAHEPKLGPDLKKSVLHLLGTFETALKENHKEYDDERAAKVLDLIRRIRALSRMTFEPVVRTFSVGRMWSFSGSWFDRYEML